MIGSLDPEKLRNNQTVMNKRGKIIGIAMMGGAILLTLVFAVFAWRSIASFNWKVTDGVITTSSYFSGLESSDRHSFLEYEYTVDGTTYTGKDSDTGTFANHPPQKGQTIKVYYNPSNPSDSLIDSNRGKGLSDLVVWVCCASPAFFFFGAIILFVSTRKQTIN